MKILAIDTSCDDTCISVIATGDKKISCQLPVASCQLTFEILSNIVSSQIKIHAKYGGVYPSLAKREHQQNLVPVLIKALNKAKMLKQIRNSKFEIRNIEENFRKGKEFVGKIN